MIMFREKESNNNKNSNSNSSSNQNEGGEISQKFYSGNSFGSECQNDVVHSLEFADEDK